MIATIGSVFNHVKGGRMRPLGVTSDTRMTQFPDVPAIAETVPGYDSAGWVGLAAPAKTPDDIIAKVNADVTALLRDPAVARQFIERSAIPSPSTPKNFAAFIDKEMATWAEVVKATGTKPGT